MMKVEIGSVGRHMKEIDDKEKAIEEKVKDTIAADKIARLSSDQERLDYDKLKREAIGDAAFNQEIKWEAQAERNLMGIELEKAGRIDEAISLYEQNVKERFDGSHPYTRLDILYHRRKQYDKEIRVLKKVVRMFKGRNKEWYFANRLEKAEILKRKIARQRMVEKEGEDSEE
jgi:tetratricopeptide (TPR) repeat protein